MKVRFLVMSLAAAVVGLPLASGFAAEGVSFAHRPLLAGKASLTSDGFEVSRTLGVAAISPELQIPVELVYDSSSESSGAFGHGWRSPQLESSVRWEKDGLLWTTPWGEKVKFFPKKEKTPKDAVKLAPIEEAKKGLRGDRPQRGVVFWRDFASFHADLHFSAKYTTRSLAK